MIETPSIKRKALKKRIDKIEKHLPTNWIVLFVFNNPDYKGNEAHLSNVRRGLSMDETVIEKMEALVELIKPTKNKAVK